MEFKELVEELKAFYGVKSLEAVAEKMGYSKNNAANWRREKALTAHALVKYQQDKANRASEPPTHYHNNNNTISVKYYPNIHASAGYGVINYESEYEIITLEKSLLIGARIQNIKNLEIIQVRGDSMLPYIKDGDRALIERECEPKNGDVVIANINGDIYVKQLQIDPLKRWIQLLSHNKEYKNIVLEGSEMESLKVIGILRGIITIKYF